ncbi:MAG: hypothetical protein Q4F56_02200 [Candidatus Saccharibacteria bacterium]|nr:hypothetical protein [Candidatus Saccharibacteria bacterium]
MGRKSRFGFGCSLLLVFVLSLLGGVNTNVFAAGTQVPQSIMNKSVFQGVYNCYKYKGQNGGYIKSRVSLGDYTGRSDSRPLNFLLNTKEHSGNDYVKLVSGWESERYKVPTGGLSCEELFNGSFGKNSNLLSNYVTSIPQRDDAAGVKKLVEDMGYTVTTDEESVCFALLRNKKVVTNQVCKNKTTGELSVDQSDMSGEYRLGVSGKDKVCLYGPGATGGGVVSKGCQSIGEKLNSKSLLNAVKGICGGLKCTWEYQVAGSKEGEKQKSSVTFTGAKKGNSVKTAVGNLQDREKAGLKAVEYLSGGEIKSLDNLRISDLEKRTLYQAYLSSYYGVSVDCGSEDAPTVSWFADSTVKKCHYNKSSVVKDAKVNGVDSSGFFEYKNLSLDQLVNEINKLKTSYSDDEVTALTKEIAKGGSASGQSQSSSSGGQATCMGSSAAASLGWILCPVIDLSSWAAETLYDDFVAPALQIDPKLFTYSEGTNDSATRQGWEIFRGFANTVFIILFLVVIFSQLTGYGIDNYGIKKILPKLIVAAILINLSYWFCIAFVDVSNIVGNGIQALFNSMSDPITMPNEVGGVNLGNATFGVVTAVGILGALVVGVWAAAGGTVEGVLVMLLVAAISIVVALLFLFLLLAAREALIVVLTMLAPLAIVCYMLPNTKKLFDRWLKLGGALLLVYPICGLLVGGGNFVSKILLAAGAGSKGFFSAFVAMIVGVAPVFLIPTVLKKSFSAAGDLGSKITNMGQRIGSRASGGAGKAMRGSEMFRSRQAFHDESRKARAAQRVVNRYGGMNRNTLSARQQEQLREAESTLNAHRMGRAAAAEGVYLIDEDLALNRARSSKEAQELKAYQDQFAGYSREQLQDEAMGASNWLYGAGGQQRMSALIGAMQKNGLEGDIYKMLESNDVRGMSGVMQTLAASDNKVLKAYGKRGSGQSYTDFMRGDGLRAYAKEKGGDFISGLDDKALAEIARNDGESGRQTMSTSQLVQAAAQLNDEGSMEAINKMLKGRGDISMNGDQLSGLNYSTVKSLIDDPSGNGKEALLKASDALAADPTKATKLNSEARAEIDKLRATRTDGGNTDPILTGSSVASTGTGGTGGGSGTGTGASTSGGGSSGATGSGSSGSSSGSNNGADTGGAGWGGMDEPVFQVSHNGPTEGVGGGSAQATSTRGGSTGNGRLITSANEWDVRREIDQQRRRPTGPSNLGR